MKRPYVLPHQAFGASKECDEFYQQLPTVNLEGVNEFWTKYILEQPTRSGTVIHTIWGVALYHRHLPKEYNCRLRNKRKRLWEDVRWSIRIKEFDSSWLNICNPIWGWCVLVRYDGGGIQEYTRRCPNANQMRERLVIVLAKARWAGKSVEVPISYHAAGVCGAWWYCGIVTMLRFYYIKRRWLITRTSITVLTRTTVLFSRTLAWSWWVIQVWLLRITCYKEC